MITFRKTRHNEWVAFGPAADIKAAAKVGTVTITKRDGSTVNRVIVGTGKTFDANGAKCCYGYLGADTTFPRQHEATTNVAYDAPHCEECGTTRGVREVFDGSGIPGYACGRCAHGISFA